MNLYEFVSGNPSTASDPTGRNSENECYCGPDVTQFLDNLVNYALQWDRQQAYGPGAAETWMLDNGGNLHWLSTGGPYKTDKCSSGDECRKTY